MSSTADAATEATGGADGDPALREMVDSLRRRLSEAVVASEVSDGDVWVRVERDAWRQAAEVCKSDLAMDYFCFLSGIDWLVNPTLSGEKAWQPEGAGVVMEGADEEPAEGAPASGVAGGDTRFQVFARLYSTTLKRGITLKADLEADAPSVASWAPVYRGADWHEREAWEMYGFNFEGHPNLRHLYLPGEFEGHPLRKDFPLLSREVKPWPGLVDVEPMPGEDAGADAEEG